LQAARDVLGTSTALDAVVADVSHEEQVADLFERIDGLDHVVSTVADIRGAYELLPDLDLKAVQRAVDSKIYAPLLLQPMEIGQDSIPSIRPIHLDGWRDLDRAVRARFVSAHFLLAGGDFVTEVPYNPDLYFRGEEIDLSVRAFTWGWDLFHPVRTLMWHNYGGFYRRKHWDDHTTQSHVRVAWQKLDRLSRVYVRTLLLKNTTDRYGCGPARTVADYEAYAGISFRERTMTADAEHAIEPRPWAPATAGLN
jgi:hypothetical protein